MSTCVCDTYFGIRVRIMKRRVRMVVVKVVVVCILKYNHFCYCYYYNPYPALHNPNPYPKVWVSQRNLKRIAPEFSKNYTFSKKLKLFDFFLQNFQKIIEIHGINGYWLIILKLPKTEAKVSKKAKVPPVFFRPTVLHDHAASRLVKTHNTKKMNSIPNFQFCFYANTSHSAYTIIQQAQHTM